MAFCLILVGCGPSDDEHLGSAQNLVKLQAQLVIKQVYARSGTSGTYSREFVEIYNRGNAPGSLSGMSLQSGTPTTTNGTDRGVTLPPAVIAPGQSFLAASQVVDQSPELPKVPDYVWPPVASSKEIQLGRPPTAGGLLFAEGVVVLRNGTSASVDLVGYGTPGTLFEGSGTAPALTDTTALLRKQLGAQDTDDNAADFATGTPSPSNMDGYIAPVAGAPVLDPTTGTTPGGLSSFVYDSTNPNAPQTGVTAGAIDPTRAGWVVGYVKDGSGAANAGVAVTVVGHSQYGQSTTRADGRFDLVVNGSANFTLRFSKSGFFSADRRVYVGAKLTASVDDVWLVAADSKTTVVTASSSSLQVAVANTVAADASSLSRTAVLMIPGQTKFKKGSTELSSMTLRLTEYTAGANGLNRMPASLTGSPAYTYAVEISADEANGQSVDFTDSGGAAKEAFFYVNDLVGFAVGSAVPTGYYDRAKQAWVASKSGKVIQVVVANGAATVDIDGGGVDSAAAVDSFGIKAAELSALAAQYGVTGQTTTTKLWRVPITHMTPYDCNWPVIPPPCESGVCPGSQGDPPPPPHPGCTGKCCGGAGAGAGADGDNQRTGSIIGCDSGMLGETVDVAGTPYSLNYSSYRTSGYAEKRQLKIGLTGAGAVHSAQTLISVDVTIAGTIHHREFLPSKNLSWTFQWDGLDAAGRSVVGSAMANVKVTSYYRNAYMPVGFFGDLPNPTSPGAVASKRAFVTYERSFQAPLMGQVPSGGWSLGDWTLNPHHFYDVLGNTVHLGSGGRIPSALQQSVISRIMGDGTASAFAADGSSATASGKGFGIGSRPKGFGGVAVAPNGDVFMVDADRNRVRRIDSAGKIWTVAGTGNEACAQNATTTPNFANSDTDATLSNITTPMALAIGSDGSIYIATSREGTIRKATPLAKGKYSLSNFAGGSSACNPTSASSAENVAATSATFKGLLGIAVGPDDSVYVLDAGDYRVRRVDPAGVISTIAGNGTSGGPARANDGKLATTVSMQGINDIAVGPDGTLYMTASYELLSVDKNGTLHFLNRAFDKTIKLADGVPLSSQVLDLDVQSVAVSPAGVVIFNDSEFQKSPRSGFFDRIWLRALAPSGLVTGLTSTPDVAQGTVQVPPASGLALGNGPDLHPRSIAAAPNGDVVVMTSKSIYRISPARLPDTTSCADDSVRYLVPSGDSGFCFDANGRHKKTIDLHTGQALYTFGYDANGVVSSIKDPGGLTTTLVKSGGNFVISPPPPGDVNQKTTVTISNGHASNISDNIGSFQPTAATNGLLSQLIDGENNLFTFTYDTDGYLASDTSPLGTQTLGRVLLAGGGKAVTLTSPLGLKTVFETTRDALNVLTHKTTFPDLTTEVKTKTPAGVDGTTARDGTKSKSITTVVTQLNGQIPLQATQTVELPSGLLMTTKRELSDPSGGPRVAKVMFDDTATPPTETTTTTYDSTGQTIVTSSPAGRTTTVKTDAAGHVTRRQIGTLTPTDFAYINGQLSTTTRGARTTNHTYVTNSADVDAGYLFQIQDPISTTEIRRDMRGRPLSTEAALGTTVASKTTYTWFKNDLLKTVRTPELSKDHTFAYNAVKEIRQYLPPALAGVSAPATNYTYTDDRELLTEQPSGLGSMTRTYIATTGQLDTIALPATSLSTLAGTVDYDYFATTDSATGAAGGRVSKITGPTAGNSLGFKYDGRLRTSQTWAGDVAAQATWLYDKRFWPKQETLVATATFDRFFGYDQDGLLVCNSPTTCNPAGADALKITHSAIHGGVTLIDQGGASGAQETWSYSDTAADQTATPTPAAFGELRAQSATVGGTTVVDIVYDAAGNGVSERRDALGRIRFKTETFRDATGAHSNVTKKREYQYDQRGQLKSVYLNGAATGTLEYEATYDKNGNRKTFKTTSAGPVTSCAVDDQDRLLNCGAITFTYYDNGEVKTKVNGSGTWTYHYDALGRLRQVVKTGGSTYDYVVDGEGRRIAKKVNGVIQKRWVYGAGLSPIAELDSSGAVVARYVYGSRKNTPDLVITRKLVSSAWVETTYRLISDSLGTPRYAVNVANKDDVQYQVSYSPLGIPSAGGGLAASTIGWLPFGFAGGLYDTDTGLVHFGAREYDPEIGRWISKDPIRFEGGQANLYVYVGNDPINSADATGLSACTLGIVGLVLSCGAAGGEIAAALGASVPTGGAALAVSIGAIAIQSLSCVSAIDSAVDACETPPSPPPCE